jgi:hypothetical protein
MKRIGSTTALVVVFAAMLVPAAQARFVGGSTEVVPLDSWTMNLFARQQAAKVSTSDTSAASYYTPEALNAWGLRMQAQAKLYTGQTDAPAASARGTDWGNVAIGLGGGVFAVMLAAGLVVSVRRSRRLVHA